jgi:CheY-like chemotaxis protein
METILLIEDNTDIRESAAELLSLEGYFVIAVNCGQDAFRLYPKLIPDVVLCDVKMPDMDGYQVYELFHNNPHTHHVPFAFMTALSEPKDREMAIAHGVTHYLIKPFDDAELLNCIHSCLKENR